MNIILIIARLHGTRVVCEFGNEVVGLVAGRHISLSVCVAGHHTHASEGRQEHLMVVCSYGGYLATALCCVALASLLALKTHLSAFVLETCVR